MSRFQFAPLVLDKFYLPLLLKLPDAFLSAREIWLTVYLIEANRLLYLFQPFINPDVIKLLLKPLQLKFPAWLDIDDGLSLLFIESALELVELLVEVQSADLILPAV